MNDISNAPCGFGTEVTLIHAGRSAIDHVHSRAASTLSVPVPPEELNEVLLALSVMPHRFSSGVGDSVVDAEPHPISEAVTSVSMRRRAETARRMGVLQF